MKTIDKDKLDIIKIGIILILSAAIVALIVLINFYMSSKMMQLQAMSASNAQRLTNIETFLNQQIQAAQQQSGQQPTQPTPEADKQ